ncbi:hypothetical protein TNCV_85701 [Trichonephila clavipes]|nr:hypothetical protein TNCV_85701 [Trichonephila clavipes]
MVSNRAEFTVGNIEKLFEEDRQNAQVKHEKWAKYYNRRRRNVKIKCEFTIRKSDVVIEAGSSDSSGSVFQSSSFEEDRPRLDQSQSIRSSESGERRGEKEKKTRLTGNQGARNTDNPKRHFSKGKQSRTTNVQKIKLPKQLVPYHQEERCKPKGEQSCPEEKDVRDPARTTRVDTTGSSPNTRITKNQSRSQGTDDSAVKDKVETPDNTSDSKIARRRIERQQVGGPHRLKSSLEMSRTGERISQKSAAEQIFIVAIPDVVKEVSLRQKKMRYVKIFKCRVVYGQVFCPSCREGFSSVLAQMGYTFLNSVRREGQSDIKFDNCSFGVITLV